MITSSPGAARVAGRVAPSSAEIACGAHALWLQAGRPEGRDVAFWLEAERNLMSPFLNEYDLNAVIVQTLRQPSAGPGGRTSGDSAVH